MKSPNRSEEASSDLLGLFIGAVLTSFLIRSWNRRTLTYLGIALSIVANGLCTQYVDYETTLVLRFVAGLGAGFYTAVAVAGLGAHSKPREAFNWMLLAKSIQLNASRGLECAPKPATATAV